MAKKTAIDSGGPRLRNGSSLYSNKKVAKTSDIKNLDPADRAWMEFYVAALKASGYTRRYISDTLGISRGLVGTLLEEKVVQQNIRTIQGDMVDGGLRLLKHAQVEFAEILLDIARRSTDDTVRLRAAESGLDRAGNVKVNKSESKLTRQDLTDKSPFEAMFEKLSGAPVEVQQRAVKLFTELEEIIDTTKDKEPA